MDIKRTAEYMCRVWYTASILNRLIFHRLVLMRDVVLQRKCLQTSEFPTLFEGKSQATMFLGFLCMYEDKINGLHIYPKPEPQRALPSVSTKTRMQRFTHFYWARQLCISKIGHQWYDLCLSVLLSPLLDITDNIQWTSFLLFPVVSLSWLLCSSQSAIYVENDLDKVQTV